MAQDWNIELVVQSIESVYSTNDTDKIRQLQDYLQTIQKSESGYQLAQLLVKNPSKYCRYFGALTFTVFLNTYKEALTHNQITSIFDELIDYTITLQTDNFDSNLFIIKKLLSNISLLFIDHNGMDNGDQALLDPLSRYFFKIGNANANFSELTNDQFRLLIHLHTIIVEDIRKRDNTKLSSIHQLIFTVIFPNLRAMYEFLIHYDITSESHELHKLALDCLFAWSTYIGMAEHGSQISYTANEITLQPLVMYTFKQLKFEDLENTIDIVSKCSTVLSQILEDYPKILNPYKPLLTQVLFEPDQFGVKFSRAILNNKELMEIYQQEIENFADLIIAYLNLNILYLARNLSNPQVLQILEMAVSLTDFPGNPIEDEKLSDQFLIFWEEFISTFIDDGEIMKNTNPTLQAEILINVGIIYWRKCHVFGSKMSTEFNHFRIRVAEVFQLLYSLLNTSIYSLLCKTILDKLIEFGSTPSQQVSLDIEASLYLIYKITDDLTFYDDESTEALIPHIDQLFQHGLIEIIDQNFKDHQINITLLNFLSSLPFYFKTSQGDKHITVTFNYLFSIILDQPTDKVHASQALISSKTILKICQNSKTKLVPFLPQLQTIVLAVIKNVQFDSLIRERLVNSFVSIVNSLKDPIKLGDVISCLVDVVLEKIALLGPNEEEDVRDYAVSLLGCIDEIAKATELPEDLDDYFTAEQSYQTQAYWTEDQHHIKQSILKVINELSLNYSPLVDETLCTEKCCHIFKCGLSEPINGPFKFELQVMFNYLMLKIQKCNSGSVSLIYKLIESIVITNSIHISLSSFEELVTKVFIDKLTYIQADTDLIKSSMGLFATVLEKSPSLVIHLPLFTHTVLKFGISALTYNETYVIKSVTKFWNMLLTLRRGKSSEQEFIRDLISNQFIIDDSHPLGYSLLSSLIDSFIDNPRSNTEYFYQLFRTLVAKYPLLVKNWLRVKLIHKLVDNGKFNGPFVDQFISKLMLTRGQRQANEVLKAFWLDCNNLVEFKQ
ncbi:member of the karyopherin-beta family [Scheffersomyces amazonensis]|uniref:member of the karyopherin-beta family n=1 Tax=Scheffersomyces amazonensis TaxID=1078765 RepID=UPI00315DE17B